MRTLRIIIVGLEILAYHMAPAQYQVDARVKVIGAMQNVMRKGDLQNNIDLDTLADKKSVYGLGPAEKLTGEIVMIGGVAFQSTIVNDSTMKVEKTSQSKAPFFAYASIESFKARELPDSISTVPQLEAYMSKLQEQLATPCIFMLSGEVLAATIHVVNLPPGSTVESPDDAHQGQRDFVLRNESVDIVGYFSTGHQGVFTHHDTFLHMHLITKDRTKLGHLDKVQFESGTVQLFLPE